MKILKIIGIILISITLILGVVFIYGINTRVSIEEFEDLYIEPSENPESGSVKVQFVGVSTLVITDDTTTFMTDGFFTRVSAMDMIFGEIEPKQEDINWGMERLGIEKLDGVFVVHSHFDHGMDAPEVAKMTGAPMYGSESTANIGRGLGLPEDQINLFENNQPIQIGNFTITPILSNHYEFADPRIRDRTLGGSQEITEPLIPPVGTFEYKMGGAYTLLVEHPRGNFVIQSSAGWKDGSLDSIQTDIVLLGIGGLGAQTEEYQAQYFEKIVDKLGAKKALIIHWDGFTGPIDEPIQGGIVLLDWIMGKTTKSFEAVEREAAKRPDLEVNLLPQWEKVVLF